MRNMSMNEEAIRELMANMKGNPELVETHISFVILTRDKVFKLKKPVQYSFLDFSTLEKRRYYCHRELELNRRLAPAMYLDVVPVVRGMDGLQMMVDESQPTIVDYALVMQRMDTRLE